MTDGRLHELFRALNAMGGSTLFVVAGTHPVVRVDAALVPVGNAPFSADDTAAMARALMNGDEVARFEAAGYLNCTVVAEGIGRFRANVFRDAEGTNMVVRAIPEAIPPVESLNLPPKVREIALLRQGLVIVTGAPRQGKSAALAAMVGCRIAESADPIAIVEDAPEYWHAAAEGRIARYDVAGAAGSYAAALCDVERAPPAVTVIDQIRDRETLEHALSLAKTGVCFATIRARGVADALERMIGFLPGERAHVLDALASGLSAVISLRLVPAETGGGRVPMAGILVNTPQMRELIAQDRWYGWWTRPARQGREDGMQTPDHHLADLYGDGRISYETVCEYADSLSTAVLTIKLEGRRERPAMRVVSRAGPDVPPGPDRMPSVTTQTQDGVFVVAPGGMLNESLARQFRDSVLARLAAGPVLLDFADVDGLADDGKPGLAACGRAAYKRRARIAIAAPSAAVRQSLVEGGYDRLFALYDTVEEALKGVMWPWR